MVDSVTSWNEDSGVFIEQFVEDVIGFSSQYGSDVSISYTTYNIIGKPSIYPDYGDFPQAFVMRTYGQWWKEAPSKTITFMPQNVGKIESQDYIDVEFEHSVYPFRVSVYETYNPGSVVRIWAADVNERWVLLWEGEPQKVGHGSRIFSPTIKTIKFPTRVLRLEFHHLHLEYYAEFDAVLLVGSKEPITCLRMDNINKEATQEINMKNIGSLTSQIMELNMHTIPSKIDIPSTIACFLHQDFPRLLLEIKESDQARCNLLKETDVLDGRSFDCLPDETIMKIFSYLDLLSLCKCAQVNRHFNSLASDSLLYTELNLKANWYCVTSKSLDTLATRCQYLQKLDLSWCGNSKSIKSSDFVNFLCYCGSQLTHLRLNSCKFADNTCVSKIATICKSLKELGLGNCTSISEPGFWQLSLLRGVQYLDLYRTSIQLRPLQDILQAMQKLKHINIGSCVNISSMDEVALTLASHNPDLVSVDFWKTYSLTPAGVRALGLCHNLQELDLGWCLGFGAPGDSLHALAKGCPHLKKLFLAALRGVSDRDLEPFIELCPSLEQVDLLGVTSISSDVCISFLMRCHKLRLLDVSFCDQISDGQVLCWQHLFPNVSIKRSFQHSAEVFTPRHQ